MAFGFVLYMKMQWVISRSSLTPVSYCYRFVHYGVGLALFGVCWEMPKTVVELFGQVIFSVIEMVICRWL